MDLKERRRRIKGKEVLEPRRDEYGNYEDKELGKALSDLKEGMSALGEQGEDTITANRVEMSDLFGYVLDIDEFKDGVVGDNKKIKDKDKIYVQPQEWEHFVYKIESLKKEFKNMFKKAEKLG